MHGARRVPGQPQEGRALVRVALDDLRDVGRDGLVVDGVRGACRGGRDGRDDGRDGAAEDGAPLERCRGFVGLRRRVCAARRVSFCLAPAAGQQASVQALLEHLHVRRLQRFCGAACKGDQDGLFEHRLAFLGPNVAAIRV